MQHYLFTLLLQLLIVIRLDMRPSRLWTAHELARQRNSWL